jgi:protocatechuate 3,4-dioxygenase alpha subunit
MDLVPSPSQTIGPFFHCYFDAYGTLGNLAGVKAKSERIRLAFRVLDGDGVPLNDAMLELWQADIGAFGRLPTDEQGACVFESVKPGCVDRQAPHVSVSVFARGLLNRLVTRVYFEGDAANADDPVLALVPEDRRETLIAQEDSAQPGTWNFAIHLCGERETVFFDV